MGSTSRGAALCKGAAGLTIHKSPRVTGRDVGVSAHDWIARHRRIAEVRVMGGERATLCAPRASRYSEASRAFSRDAKVLINLGHLPLLPCGRGVALPPVIRVVWKLVRVAYPDRATSPRAHTADRPVG